MLFCCCQGLVITNYSSSSLYLKKHLSMFWFPAQGKLLTQNRLLQVLAYDRNLVTSSTNIREVSIRGISYLPKVSELINEDLSSICSTLKSTPFSFFSTIWPSCLQEGSKGNQHDRTQRLFIDSHSWRWQ